MRLKLIGSLCTLFLVTSCTLTNQITIGCEVGELIDAINSANANPSHTKIILDESCLYNLTEVNNTIDWQEEFTGESGNTGLPAITTPVTIEGNQATIQRAVTLGAPEFRILFVTSTGDLTLNNVSLYYGEVQSGQHNHKNGGAIYNRGGVLTLNESHVMYSSAADNGGGIYNAEGDIAIHNTSISFNDAGRSGGALLNGRGTVLIDGYSLLNDNSANHGGAVSNFKGDLTITFGHINNNEASMWGGAIYSVGPGAQLNLGELLLENNSAGSKGGALSLTNSTFAISDCIFLGNQTLDSGGAIYNSNGNGSITAGTNFENNTAEIHGGAILSIGNSQVEIHDSTIQNNQANTVGGGVYNAGVSAMTIDNTTIAGNSALSGGGISGGYLVITNSTLNDNAAVESGGGIADFEELEMTNSTISGNQAIWGGGIKSVGNAIINFSSIAYNDAIHGAGIYLQSGIVQITNSIVGNNSAYNCTVNTDFGTLNPSGENLVSDNTCGGFSISADPMLAPLADNGGPTFTHALLPGSPAIDTASGNCPALDQRGVSRPPGACDLGSYELNILVPPIPPLQEEPPSDSASPTPTPTSFQEPFGNIPELTLCWVGPAGPYDVVSSLQPGTRVELLGTGEGGGYLVVQNPKYNLPCWVREGAVETGGFDLFSLPVIKIPPLPTPTPTAAPLGCWVSDGLAAGPRCVSPCPDTKKYPQTCTP